MSEQNSGEQYESKYDQLAPSYVEQAYLENELRDTATAYSRVYDQYQVLTKSRDSLRGDIEEKERTNRRMMQQELTALYDSSRDQTKNISEEELISTYVTIIEKYGYTTRIEQVERLAKTKEKLMPGEEILVNWQIATVTPVSDQYPAPRFNLKKTDAYHSTIVPFELGLQVPILYNDEHHELFVTEISIIGKDDILRTLNEESAKLITVNTADKVKKIAHSYRQLGEVSKAMVISGEQANIIATSLVEEITANSDLRLGSVSRQIEDISYLDDDVYAWLIDEISQLIAEDTDRRQFPRLLTVVEALAFTELARMATEHGALFDMDEEQLTIEMILRQYIKLQVRGQQLINAGD